MLLKNTSNALRIISVGGTFEKIYDPIAGYFIFDQTHVPQLIARARITKDMAYENLKMMDSLDMQDIDRIQLLLLQNLGRDVAN